jgi:hypothetical protein
MDARIGATCTRDGDCRASDNIGDRSLDETLDRDPLRLPLPAHKSRPLIG